MRRPRFVIAACCLLLGVACLGAPAIALAGGSAGDQQYTDPFSGSSSPSASTTTSAPAQTQSAPATSQTTPAASPDTSPSQTTPASTTPAPTATDPTATVAAPSTGTLPYTGYAAWTAAGFGLALLGAGLVLRLRTRAVR